MIIVIPLVLTAVIPAAGVTDNLIVWSFAKEILKELETEGKVKIITRIEKEDSAQIGFADFNGEEIISKLKSLDVSTITPIEAMSILYELSNKAKQ